jgi:hypothetical protein
MPDLLLIAMAFAIGALMAQVSLCAVAALQSLIEHRSFDGALRIALASGAAGITLLGLAAAAGGMVRLPLDPPITAETILGGALLGAGAALNGACMLGTIHYLSRGRWVYLATWAGMAAALRTRAQMLRGPMSEVTRMPMSDEIIVGLCFFLVLSAMAATRHGSRRAAPGPAVYAALIGVLAGVLYSGHPNWNYANIIAALAQADRAPVDWLGQLSAAALLAGATIGAGAAGRLRMELPQPVRMVRCLAGGALMGVGAAHAGGGHDLLLLWSIPGLSRRALAAYLVMAATIASILWLVQLLPDRIRAR